MTAAEIEKMLESYQETETDLHRQAIAVMEQAQQEIDQLYSRLDVGAVSYDRDVVQGGTQSMLAESVIDTVGTIKRIAQNKVDGIYRELYKLEHLYCCILELSPKLREVITRLYMPRNKTDTVSREMRVNQSTISLLKRKALSDLSRMYDYNNDSKNYKNRETAQYQAIQGNPMQSREG